MGSAAVFSLNVWAIVVFISPLFLTLTNFSGLYFFATLYGIFFSIPALIVFLLTVSVINKQIKQTIYKKLILAAIGFIFTFLTFRLLGGFIKQFWAPYCITLVAAIFIFKLNPSERSKEDS